MTLHTGLGTRFIIAVNNHILLGGGNMIKVIRHYSF